MCQKGIALGLLLVAVLATTAKSQPVDRAQRVYAGKIDTVVLITAGKSRGSGFLIGPHFIVTNEHVVKDHAHVDVYFPVPSRSGDYVNDLRFYLQRKDVLRTLGYHVRGSVIVKDKEYDLAIVLIDSDSSGMESVEVAACRIDQNVHILGNPKKLGLWRWTGGRVIDCRDDEIIIEANVYHGNSGGPVLDDDGRVVGVIVRSALHMEASAIPIVRVRDLVEEIIRREELGQQVIELVSFQTKTEFPVTYGFRCHDSSEWDWYTVNVRETKVHWCYRGTLSIDVHPSVIFHFNLDGSEIRFREASLESNWQFTLLDSIREDEDFLTSSAREYHFLYDTQGKEIYLTAPP